MDKTFVFRLQRVNRSEEQQNGDIKNVQIRIGIKFVESEEHHQQNLRNGDADGIMVESKLDFVHHNRHGDVEDQHAVAAEQNGDGDDDIFQRAERLVGASGADVESKYYFHTNDHGHPQEGQKNEDGRVKNAGI